ncbi:MAG: outer membrane beta-barrel family protein, partial [Pseudomonadota bacterium]|nr:outer membrane beta-barrel family protein [Pseudomonadota bacterium]
QFTQIQQDAGGGVLLSTQANLGHSRNAGLELVSNGDLSKTLSYNISGNVYWNEIDPGNLTLASRRSGTTVSGRISLNWSPTPKNFFQVNFNGRGKTLNGQGYYGAFTGLNLGYRHKFDDKLALVVTLADPFDQTRFDSYIDTASLKQQSRYSYHQRALFLGFTYALGTAKTRASEGFDFGSGGGGK